MLRSKKNHTHDILQIAGPILPGMRFRCNECKRILTYKQLIAENFGKT
jgi:hypothetical protein